MGYAGVDNLLRSNGDFPVGPETKDRCPSAQAKAFSATASKSNRKISFLAHVRWCEHGAPVLFLFGFPSESRMKCANDPDALYQGTTFSRATSEPLLRALAPEVLLLNWHSGRVRQWQGLKPNSFCSFMARLKLCPDTKRLVRALVEDESVGVDEKTL
jgi:hypothetical protein